MIDLDRIKALLGDLPIHGGISLTDVAGRKIFGVDGLTVSTVDPKATADDIAVAIRKAFINRSIAQNQPPPIPAQAPAPLSPQSVSATAASIPVPSPIPPRRANPMSLMGKLQHLQESARDFERETGSVLDGIVDKMNDARKQRDIAAAKHHGYYDGMIKQIQGTVDVIEQLSNSPLPDDGGT